MFLRFKLPAHLKKKSTVNVEGHALNTQRNCHLFQQQINYFGINKLTSLQVSPYFLLMYLRKAVVHFRVVTLSVSG